MRIDIYQTVNRALIYFITEFRVGSNKAFSTFNLRLAS